MRRAASQLVDPDPVSVGLGILGALGSVASIASYASHVADTRRQRREDRRKVTQELIEMSVEIESSVNELQSQYEKIRMLIEKNAPFLPRDDENEGDPMGQPFELGGMLLLLPKSDFTQFSRAHQRILQTSKVLIKQVYRIVQSLHIYRIGIGSDTYGKRIELRVRMNKLMANRLEYGEALTLYSELLSFASDVSRMLKKEFLSDQDGTPNARSNAG